jgi:hypothetical protein
MAALPGDRGLQPAECRMLRTQFSAQSPPRPEEGTRATEATPPPLPAPDTGPRANATPMGANRSRRYGASSAAYLLISY